PPPRRRTHRPCGMDPGARRGSQRPDSLPRAQFPESPLPPRLPELLSHGGSRNPGRSRISFRILHGAEGTGGGSFGQAALATVLSELAAIQHNPTSLASQLSSLAE